MIAFVRRRGYGDLGAVRDILLTAARRAAFTGRYSDIVSVLCKVGDELVISSHLKAIAGIGADNVVALCPVHKMIAFVRRRGDGDLGAVRNILLATVRRAAFTGRYSDIVSILCKVGDEIAISSHLKAIAGIGADFAPVLRPVHKVIAFVWRRGDVDLAALFNSVLCAAHAASFSRRSRESDLVCFHIFGKDRFNDHILSRHGKCMICDRHIVRLHFPMIKGIASLRLSRQRDLRSCSRSAWRS